MKNPFKAYDVRGVFNAELLPEDVLNIGCCYADYVKQKTCIGCDVRTTSTLLKKAFIAGVLSAGYDIVDIGTLPTPIINYYGINHQMDNVTITGSHTQPNNNGLKFFDKLGIVYNDRLRKLEQKFVNNDFQRAEWDEIGKLSTDNKAVQEYSDNITTRIKLEKKMKIVLDHGNGATGPIASKILKKLGCEVVNINEEVDGLFPNRSPEPKKDNIAYLQKRVVETKSDFGCAFDGDGDRSVFVDDKGNFWDGSKMSSFFAKEVIKQDKNAYIIASVDTSSVLKKVVEENNGNMVWCAVGMKNVENTLIDNKGMFGGEVSSHFYFNDFYPFSDGILSCAKLAQMLSRNEKRFSELMKELPDYPIKHSKYHAGTHVHKFEAFEKIKEELMKEYKINTIDGIKFFTNETDWVLIRPSNTEPVIRITIEASNKEDLEKTFEKFEKMIKKFL